MWDMSILQVVPGLRIAAPRDGARLTEQLREAVEVTDGPTVVRFPKGPAGDDVPAIERTGGVDVLSRSEDGDVLLVAVGAMAGTAVEAARLIGAHGIGVTVVDPRWVKPLDEKLVSLAAEHRLVAVVEDNIRVGGVGDAVARLLRDADVDVPVRTFGIPQEFLDHAKRAQILTDIGLTPQGLARDITAAIARDSVLEPTE
jgi:1-deoxy-D-xylulose-5-phosphate synthase